MSAIAQLRRPAAVSHNHWFTVDGSAEPARNQVTCKNYVVPPEIGRCNLSSYCDGHTDVSDRGYGLIRHTYKPSRRWPRTPSTLRRVSHQDLTATRSREASG